MVRRRRKRTSRSPRLVFLRRAAIVVALVVLSGVVLGIAFAGSPARLASGVRIAGVDVGGLTPGAAKGLLREKWRAREHVPVSFRVGGRVWRLSASQLGVRPDWGAAVDDARRQGEGFGPLRGFRRLDVRVFGADVAPPTSVYDTALAYVLDRIGREVDLRHQEASVVLRGLQPQVVPGRAGRSLDKQAAETTIVRALTGLSSSAVDLPVRTDTPRVMAGDLTVVVAEVKTALAAPVHLTLGQTRFSIRPARIAQLLELPADGRRDIRIGGQGADRWFAQLSQHVDRAPVDATWSISSSGIHVVPDQPGYSLDVAKSAKALLRAVLVTEPTLRDATLVAETTHAARTAKDAEGMHISGLVASYETFYGGEANRIHTMSKIMSGNQHGKVNKTHVTSRIRFQRGIQTGVVSAGSARTYIVESVADSSQA